MTDTTTPASLPVVAWQEEGRSSFISQRAWENNSFYLSEYTVALTPQAPAQTVIDGLRAEVKVLRAAHDEMQQERRDWEREVERLRAQPVAARPDVEAVMALADKYADTSVCRSHARDEGVDSARERSRAARSALRAALTQALQPADEARDAARPGTALVSHTETVSNPGAALKVQMLHLTDAGRECLTLNAAAAKHLHRLLGWADCEVGQAPDEMVQGVRELAARGLETDDAGKARLLQAHQTASNVPKYIRAAIKSLRVAMSPSSLPAAAKE